MSEQGERGYQALLIDTNERNLRGNSAARGRRDDCYCNISEQGELGYHALLIDTKVSK